MPTNSNTLAARKKAAQDKAESSAKELATTKESGSADSERSSIRWRAIMSNDKKGNSVIKSGFWAAGMALAQAGRAARNRLRRSK